MPRVARLPDGTTLRFPDGTPDEVIQRVVKSRIQGGGKPTGPWPAPGPVRRFLEPAAQAGKDIYGAFSGSFQVPGAISDLMGHGPVQGPVHGALAPMKSAINAGSVAGRTAVALGEGLVEGSKQAYKDELGRTGSSMRAALNAVPFVGVPAMNTYRNVEEGNYAGALGELALLVGPEVLRLPSGALLRRTTRTKEGATGLARDVAREAGLNPVKAVDPFKGVGGNPGTALQNFRDMSETELRGMGIAPQIRREITTPSELLKDIRESLAAKNQELSDAAEFKRNMLDYAKDKELAQVDERFPGYITGEPAVVAPEAGVRGVAGTSPISSASAGRRIEKPLRRAAKEAQEVFGEQGIGSAEAPLLDIPIPTERLLKATEDFDPELSPGAAYVRRKLSPPAEADEAVGSGLVGPDGSPISSAGLVDEAGDAAIPFSDVRTLNKRLRGTPDLVAKGASKAARDEAMAVLRETDPAAAAQLEEALARFNENVAAPFRRGAPAKGIKALLTENPQKVTAVPLDAPEQWGMLVGTVKNSPKALKALRSDVIHNRMKLKSGMNTFVRNWEVTPLETKAAIFGKETASAVDDFIQTVKALEAEAGNTKGAFESSVKNLKEEIAGNYKLQKDAVKAQRVAPTSRLEAIQTVLDQYQPRGFAGMDPKIGLWGRAKFTVYAMDSMAHLLGIGNVEAAHRFATAFNSLVKTGRPQGIINTIATIQRVERKNQKQEEIQ